VIHVQGDDDPGIDFTILNFGKLLF
jgi:hypothetical protein